MSIASMVALQALIYEILQSPHDREWSLQGLGMLRTYLSDDKSLRLHIWSPQHRIPHVSEAHIHPWDFRSTLISGNIWNTRYVEAGAGDSIKAQEYATSEIICGEGGGLTGEEGRIMLRRKSVEPYRPGDTYKQRADEIHSTEASFGAVTVVERKVIGDPDCSRVYWPVGEEFVSAHPRPATDEEVEFITQLAIKNWSV